MQWADDPSLAGLILLASYPASGTDVAGERPVLALVGSEDGASSPEEVAPRLDVFDDDTLFYGVVDGLNHYGWTDDAKPSELRGDGPETRPRDEARHDALRVLDTWLDAWLRDDADAQDRLDTPFAGVTR